MLLLDSLLRASSGRIIGSTNVLFLFIWIHRGGLGNICRVLVPKFISILLVEGHAIMFFISHHPRICEYNYFIKKIL